MIQRIHALLLVSNHALIVVV